MKRTLILIGLLSSAFFAALAPCAVANTAWYVDGVNGSDTSNCLLPETACKTIGHAVSLVSSGDSIIVAAATYHENIAIGISLNVIGSGTDTAIIDGGGKGIVVSVPNATANVALSNLIIQNGTVNGISNAGSLKITNSTVRNNSVYQNCYAYCLGAGAGIRNEGAITISDSTIANNSIRVYCSRAPCLAFGAGIWNQGGRITIVNSTLSGNSVSDKINGYPYGGCGAIVSTGNQTSLTINSSTIAGNSSNGSCGGIAGGTTVIRNSIVANNLGGNCAGPMASQGYNLSSDNTCNFSGPGDLNNHDPLLGPLQNNGGPTQTMALLPGSPAIDGGNPAGCTDGLGNLLKTDQRGMPRPDKEDTGGCDMGAYESQSD